MPSRLRRAVSKAPIERSSEPTREALLAALAERERELTEAHEQQAAVAEVLEVINASPGDLAPVFDTIVKEGARLCDANNGTLWLVEDGTARLVDTLSRGPGGSYLETLPAAHLLGRDAQNRPFLHIEDLKATKAYQNGVPLIVGSVDIHGARTVLIVPLVDAGRVVGVFTLDRNEVRPFGDRQIALVQAFAAQALIAIKNARLFKEALERQTATAEILKVIASSPSDVQPVFQAIADSAKRLLGGFDAVVHRYEGEWMHLAAQTASNPAEDAVRRASFPMRRPPKDHVWDDLLRRQGYVEVDDTESEANQPYRHVARARGYRAYLNVQLKVGEESVGAIVVTRKEPGKFAPHLVELLRTFADQAVIAIQNARLFNETQEALEQQRASAEILAVISKSVADAQPVFGKILESCKTLFNGDELDVLLIDEEGLLQVAAYLGKARDTIMATFPAPWEVTPAGRAIRERRVANYSDVLNNPDTPPVLRKVGKIVGYHSVAFAPMIWEDRGIGAVGVARSSGAFTDKEMALLQTFADQAAIAIQNARLFHETQAKTRDLAEALQQQTATAEVLKVISRSAFDLDAVLSSLTKSAVELCNSTYGVISLYRDGLLKFMAQTGCTPEFAELLWSHPAQLDRKSATGRTGLLRTVVLVPDVTQDEEYDYHGGEIIGNYRSMMGVPLLRNGELEGVFTLMRREPGTFTQQQVELVQTFADQAVIAIENVRLFNEVQARTRDLTEALQLQTATSDVLKVISRSAFDLQAVFGTLISSAVELCGADGGTICVRDGEVFRFRASAGASQTEALNKYLEEHPATPGSGSTAGRVLLSGKVEAIPDCFEDPDYAIPMDSLSQSVRSILGVPLLGKVGIEGALVITRKEPGHFTSRQVEIVQTFADQAVIAIENVRLFDEVQARTRELAASLDDLRKAQDRLIQSEKLASLGQLTAGIAHEIKNPLNFVNNFSALSRELLDELGELLAKAKLAEAERREIEDLVGMVTSNLDKVVTHGKRADSIVKNMLLHSREGSGTLTTVDVNALVEDALNLAWHGARAEKPDFKVTIDKALDPNAGVADLYPQEMTRVLLNLISNGFYATTKRRSSERDTGYEPTVTASTRGLGDQIEIVIRDNGIGIADDVKAKIFNPFFTTKPAGEGTGLGLSMSHDIIVKQHGGNINVATATGEFTEFSIVLPRGGQTSG